MRTYSRYDEHPLSQSFSDTRTKNNSKTKLPANGSISKNPQNELVRLPALNGMRRSASVLSTDRNTKFKLISLQAKLQELAADVHNTRLDAQETRNHIIFLHQSMVAGELKRQNEDLRKQVKGFERLVMSTKASNEDRSRCLRQDCGVLWEQTEAMRQAVFELRMRLENMQDSLGFHKDRQI